MTQTTHTPGPWRVVSDGISHWIEIEPNKIALIKANKADRDLIAAAPDLLIAAVYALADLEGIMPDFEPSGLRKHPAWMTIKDLHAAIAKAKGA